MLRLFLLVLLALPFCGVAAADEAPHHFDLQAHRGGRDARPENTLVSFAYAMELGVTTLEMDLQLTADGHLVVSHNPTLSPVLTRDEQGKYVEADRFDLRAMNLSEIKKFDVGVMSPEAGDYFREHGKTQIGRKKTAIPTLEEVFDLVREYGDHSIRFNIETKSYPDARESAHAHSPDPLVFVRAVDQIVRKYEMQRRVTLQSFDWATLRAMRTVDREIVLVALTSEQPSGGTLGIGNKDPSPWLAGLNINDFHGDYVKAAKSLGIQCVSPYWEELTPMAVREAHAAGMTVIPWTVNKAHDMALLIDMGVDGIITDRPWILRDVLQQRHWPLPAPVSHPSSESFTGTKLREGAAP